MNNIESKASETRTNGLLSNKSAESVETAGSLAMNKPHSLFETKVYDVFSSSNPFSVDYSQYSNSSDTVAYSGGFLASFSNAVSTLSTSTLSTSSFSSGTSSAGTCSGGGFSGGSCSSGGGFSSVC